MKLVFHFNFPANRVSVSAGHSTTYDAQFDYRLGVTTEDDNEIIHWFTPGWFSGAYDDMPRFVVDKKDKVFLERRVHGSPETQTGKKFDIGKDWPFEARDIRSTEKSWYF